MQRTLGKSGLQASAVGMGCWAIGGPFDWAQPGQDAWAAGWGKVDDAESISAIHAGLDAGVNFFDTAANYGAGHSEVILGQALAGKRDSAVIATKFGHIVNEKEKFIYADDSKALDNVRGDIENSLRRLNTDYVDIYQFHLGNYEPSLALDIRGVLEDLVATGKIRWYGWSTDLLDRASIFADGEHCTSIQFSLNALKDNADIRKLCSDYDLAGINKDPLNQGVLTGKFTTESTFAKDDIRARKDFKLDRFAKPLKTVEALREILTSGGRTMAQGALAYIWALDDRMIPIPGFRTVEQVQDNAGAMEFGPLTQEELMQVQAITAEGVV
jgi:aryl-alcohol dehydrogenase-like predicted oxidoreductase